MNRIDGTDVICDRWMDYLSVSSETALPPEFKLHMKTCAVCRDEWQQLRIVWEALAMDTEQLEVPETLKSDVMQAIFGEAELQDGPAKARRSFQLSRLSRWRWPLTAAACAVLVLAGWGVWKLADPFGNREAGAIITPTQTVLKEWKLAAAQKTMPAAKASIQLVLDGNVQKVVVQAEGLAPTHNDWAYQVWLVNQDRRYNCGTFRVDDSGKGVLVYDLKRPDVHIDDFGITLEPDATGTTPRGSKVLGTTVNNNPS